MNELTPPDSSLNTFTARIRKDIQGIRRYRSLKKLFRADLAKNLSIRGSGDGNALLVVANGPSAANVPVHFVEEFQKLGGRVMAMNWAHLNPAVQAISIDYYLSADEKTVGDDPTAEALRSYLQSNESLMAFVPEIRLARWQEVMPRTNLVPFCRLDVKYLRWHSWGLSPMRPKPFTAQSGLHALQMATWMEFSEIYIIGFDNSYFREFLPTGENVILLHQTYAGEAASTKTFHGDTASMLEAQASLFRDYWLFAGQNIFNLDPHSPTDAFPKVPFEQALKKDGR